MTSAGFDSFVTGKAFAYARDGRAFGVEAYRAGQQVLWLGADGSCLAGNWYEKAGAICFVYDIDATGIPRVCAPIYAEGAGLRAEETSGAVVIGEPTPTPDLTGCPGPKVGA